MKWYSVWEKGLLVVSLAWREVKRTICKQSIVLRGPFKIIKPMLGGTPPADREAQRAFMWKWCTQLEHCCDVFEVSEGASKILAIQEAAASQTKSGALPPKVVQAAPPFSEQLQNVWFTDVSAKREGKTWKY